MMTLTDEQLAASPGPWFPSRLTVMNGWVYFEAYTPPAGYELWRTNGTVTVRIADINQGSDSDWASLQLCGTNRVAELLSRYG